MADPKEKESPMNVGRIVRVIGPVIDVEYAPESIPAIYNALTVDAISPVGRVRLVAEVEQHLEGNVVRAVAMSSTDGITRG
ncbi:MAG TPA: F0F1 ATP synthase subunit beta, partial [Coriobacteriia bacterium]|nr:F0F1 ATP synthase subunit beta [Coriobacteriia bacterium]